MFIRGVPYGAFVRRSTDKEQRDVEYSPFRRHPYLLP